MSSKSQFVSKWVLVGLLIGWFIKMPYYFWTYFNGTNFQYPVEFEFFPSFFENPYTAVVFYYLPAITLIVLFIKNSKVLSYAVRGAAALFLVSSIIMMIHLTTYNDATFVTSFWVSLWLLWFSFHTEEENHEHAVMLALGIVSLTFFGGFIGKCSSEWWSGEVLYGLMNSFFIHWPFGWLKNNMTFDQLKLIARLLSIGVIIIELAIASCIFWPRRFALKYVPIIILGIVFFRTWKILSVISCLIAMSWACLKLLAKNEECHEIQEGTESEAV